MMAHWAGRVVIVAGIALLMLTVLETAQMMLAPLVAMYG